MEDNQIEQLGSKMRNVYDDLAADPPQDAPQDAPKHPSRRLRKNRYITRVAARAPRRNKAAGLSGVAAQRPFTLLLISAGVGYLAARLSR